MPVAERRAPDQDQRDRVVADLDRTLFVEAGAGSGKTTALVARVLALVATGTTPLSSVAAITFTDKAALELRQRIRQGLTDRAAGDDDPAVRDRCRAALDELDAAAIGTLHAFAQRLLREFPVEAGLPPRVEVLDEVSSGIEVERRWSAFQEELLDDPDVERSLLLLLAGGVKAAALRTLALAFERDWDLVEERVPTSTPEPPSPVAAVRRLLPELDDLCCEGGACTDPEDGLAKRLCDIAAYADRLRGWVDADDELALLAALGDERHSGRPSFSGNPGRKERWPDKPGVVARMQAAGDQLLKVRKDAVDASARRIGSALRAFTLRSAEERRAAGTLDFHDLLVLARRLLRAPDHGPAVRARLHDRYRHLLLDELQDTDPIQVELAVRIAAEAPGTAPAGTAPWTEVPVRPGQLFMVGDPKQSIYRFRRADLSVFLDARRRFGPEGGGVVGLTANFRTAAPILDWVNATFSSLMGEPSMVELPVPSAPDYTPLVATRAEAATGPSVSVLGREAHPYGTRADEVRAEEAGEVAAVVARVVAEGWSVADGGGGWRPACLGDIAILVPARTSLPFLEDALDAAGIAYRAEASSLVYATSAVRDLLRVLRAVDDPSDSLRVVTALRTPLLACGDDDLFRFKVERGGRWSYLADQPDTVPIDDPVRAGLAYLRALHDERRWRSPSELLERIARDRRAYELGFAEGRPRDVWRRLRFVIDQARSWRDATGGGLREYLQWVRLQTAEGARVAEAVLPETDDDAVRILTIHAAKGLEFPVTVLSGMSTGAAGRWASAQVVFPPGGDVGYRFGRSVATEEFEDYRPIDDQMGADERVRLLYVAATRARDHLVVSLHRSERRNPPAPAQRTNAELLVAGSGALLAGLPDGAQGAPGHLTAAGGPARPAPPIPFERWEAERRRALEAAAAPTAVAATALTGATVAGRDGADVEHDAGLRKRPRDLDLPPWLKGRYGTAVGRAVHGVLQTVDLATGAGLDAAVAAQCQAEALPERTDDVAGLARAALASPSVREAAAAPHWREVYVCTPVGDRLLEGYVDLLYRCPEGLVVVDHKTAGTPDPDELDRRTAGYRLQGAAYALAVAATTGEPVIRVTFVFLTPAGAIERDLPDLERAVEEVAGLVRTGRARVLEDEGVLAS